MKEISRQLNIVYTYLIYILVFLLPLTTFPISPNPFVPARLLVLVTGVLILLMLKIAITILEGKLTWNVSKFDIPMLLIGIAFVLSTYFRTPNKMDALLLPGVTSAVVASIVLYFLVNQLSKKRKDFMITVLLASATVFSVVLLGAFFGVNSRISGLPEYVKLTQFNTAGGYLPAAIFLTISLALGLNATLRAKDTPGKILRLIGVGFVTIALVVSVFNVLPGKQFSPRLPSYTTGWVIAVDSLKASPLMGVGPGNYLTAFSSFKPADYMATELWNVKYTSATSFFMTIITETGLLGLAGVALMLWVAIKYLRDDVRARTSESWGFDRFGKPLALILSMLALTFLPATVLVIAIVFIVLALVSSTNESTMNLSATSAKSDAKSRFPALIITLPIVIAIVYVALGMVRIARAENTYRRSLAAVAANDAISAYDAMQLSIQQNPGVDRYHNSYSQISLALANALAGAGEDLTDEERAQIVQLVQQSIREAKATVALNRFRSDNWEQLGRTYQAIAPLAEGADEFAAQSFAQAVALEPLDPDLRIALGGLFYAAKNYEQAADIFILAVRVKPDHANGHYNLAFAYKELGNIDLAINSMSTALSLVDRDSPDYEVARSALEALQSEREAKLEASGETLTNPPGEVEKILEPPVELGEEEQPPAAPEPPEGEEGVSPTPTIIP